MWLESPTLPCVKTMLNKCTREAANPHSIVQRIEIQNPESIGTCFYFEIIQFPPSCFSFKFSTRFSKNVLFKMEMQLVAPWKLNRPEFRVKNALREINADFAHTFDLQLLFPTLSGMFTRALRLASGFPRWNLTLSCHCTAGACWGFGLSWLPNSLPAVDECSLAKLSRLRRF